ncbi:polyribonucleotide nucleotidyltransferase [candidate division KSB1 bacterium]|nr:polyribonucleotide nucleotidyltransferase [candidate division KSB1 bacterium]
MFYRHEVEIDGKPLIIETGKMAKQTDGAAWVQLGETAILATAVSEKQPKDDLDFFPLTVEYREKAYAMGKIPGGFFKRETKPSEVEILNARQIDRPIRPLFPDNFRHETQIFVWVLSSDRENDADVLGITGASIALSISDIPFAGPIAGVRVGRIEGEMIANPTYSERERSDFDLVIAASKDSIIMVEGEALEISEDEMVEALEFGHEAIRKLIAVQEEVVAKVGKEKRELAEPEDLSELESKIRDLAMDDLKKALEIKEKEERHTALHEIQDRLIEELEEEFPEQEKAIGNIFHDMEKQVMRAMVLDENQRLDGRGPDEIRDISIEVGVLPRAHGTALFTRGQTQALAAATLGTKVDEQKIEGMSGEFYKSYMLHYNFPPFSTGEVKPVRGTSRREVGHGNLAERALKPMIPSMTAFPYTVRVVSDILESNGSSSMATVCAGSLALMDAGVPIKAPVAGIAMGLIKEGEKVSVLTDILGDEDHMGDMDFKVAGSEDGITAFQMDIKIQGISMDIMREALERAKKARLFVLGKMNEVLPQSRTELSTYAPRIFTMKINPDQIGSVIGPGGKTIREIVEKTGASIDIEDDGTVKIASVEPEAGEEAKRIIRDLTAEVEIGAVYTGKVKRILKFGAFVEILPGREGLVHISELEHHRVNKVEDVVNIGDEVTVKVIKKEDGKIDLSRKALLEKPKPSQS